jgi:uncharacterized protein (DUF58 family)
MTHWRPTVALSRALLVSAVGIGLGVLFGEPELVVLVAPLVVLAALGLLHRPASAPRVYSSLDHVTLHEGQGTRCRLVLEDADDVEHVTRVAAPAPFVAMHPADGHVGFLYDDGADQGVLEVSPRRWGVRLLGEEKIGLTSPWAGYERGPVPISGRSLSVLPVRAPFDSRAEAPQPIGLVGRHRSRRPGDGTEFAAIRPFQGGDRLRRINWRVSLRTGALHVVSTRAEQDAGVLLVVDGLADHGRSEGVGGAASSLDVTVRAASALAEHYVRGGDRVSLRVIGAGQEVVGYGSGTRHLRILQGRHARIRPGEPRRVAPERLHFNATAGTVVVVLSPMLSDAMGTTVALLTKRACAASLDGRSSRRRPRGDPALEPRSVAAPGDGRRRAGGRPAGDDPGRGDAAVVGGRARRRGLRGIGGLPRVRRRDRRVRARGRLVGAGPA